MNTFRHQTHVQISLRQWLLVVVSVVTMVLTASRITLAQAINIDRVAAEFEPEIQRTLLEGKIPSAAGGVFKGKRIISEQTLEQMFTRQYDQFKGPVVGSWGNESAGFGLTWWVQTRDGDRYFAHSGSGPFGYTAFLLGSRDRKLGFAVLTNGNRAHPHLFKLADRAMDLLKKHANLEVRQ